MGCKPLEEKPCLTAKMERFLTAYLATNNICVACRTAGINESTGHRWLKLEVFQTAFRLAQKQLFESELNGLLRIVGKAIDTLERNLSGEDVPPSTQVAAARIVLEQAQNIATNAEIAQRLDALEDIARQVPHE